MAPKNRSAAPSIVRRNSPLSKYVLCLTTVPNASAARRLAEILVKDKVAACVNVLGGVRSVYRWKGTVESAREHLLIAKTTRRCWPAFKARLTAIHPYEVPEILVLPIQGGLAEYLSWISDNTGKFGFTDQEPVQ